VQGHAVKTGRLAGRKTVYVCVNKKNTETTWTDFYR